MTLLLGIGSVWIMKGDFISRSLLYSHPKRFLSKLGYIKGRGCGYGYLIRGATIQVTAWPHTSDAVSLSWPGHIATSILKWMLVCCPVPLYIVLQAQLELKSHKNAEWSRWEKWPLWFEGPTSIGSWGRLRRMSQFLSVSKSPCQDVVLKEKPAALMTLFLWQRMSELAKASSKTAVLTCGPCYLCSTLR